MAAHRGWGAPVPGGRRRVGGAQTEEGGTGSMPAGMPGLKRIEAGSGEQDSCSAAGPAARRAFRVVPGYAATSCAPRTSQRMKAIAVGRSWMAGGATT